MDGTTPSPRFFWNQEGADGGSMTSWRILDSRNENASPAQAVTIARAFTRQSADLICMTLNMWEAMPSA